ncbi:MAG: molybdenum cofactor biosynthesis protein MoaE [Bosea sp. (in: a-proteobacteria)]
MAIAPLIRIQREPFDLTTEIARITAGQPNIGAITTFTGLCRDEGGRLKALELEHYPGMAEAEIARVAAEACTRWPLMGLTAIHRHGLVKPGEDIVLVIAASSHRLDAFAGAEFMMDYLKAQAPFWKREHLTDGSIGGWVEAKASDDTAVRRWQTDGGRNAEK